MLKLLIEEWSNSKEVKRMYSKMVLLFQDGSHVESYEGAGRIMHAKWNHSSDKVSVSIHKDKYLDILSL